ncbi:MAG: tRNA preQ1(34) S-adenosylmethionine ribosyltransferase-isomerase QueA [Verrucomicrobia bacterium]|nr:tRNA preQ1(34) S-adenosylmethionine ribosyltransferase-isomerase QueA [Verrucomicrobiota bacterium]
MRTADFNFELPAELIAQAPAAVRDESRLLVFERPDGQLAHRHFRDLIDHLHPGDLLVMNNSKVIPARLRGVKAGSGGAVEALLVEEVARNDWWVMVRPGKRVRPGSVLHWLDHHGQLSALSATCVEKNAEGHCRLQFAGARNVADVLTHIGEVPLPPYITRAPHFNQRRDLDRYQTVYAEADGSVAAPTAGLHFTPALLDEIRARGVRTAFVTLHVGLGTFAPVKAAELKDHVMHEERFAISEETAALVAETKSKGGRVVAVGTTSLRVLESVAHQHDQVRAVVGRTQLFLHPPAKFKVVDALVTNFHLPESTLLMLVCAFASPGTTRGRELMLAAYAEAVRERYRFFSYGDAMLIT